MSEDRKTFTVPDGFEAVFSADGRATGEVRKTRETLEREASHWLQQARDNLKAGQDCLAKLEAAERKAAELEAREARLSEARDDWENEAGEFAKEVDRLKCVIEEMEQERNSFDTHMEAVKRKYRNRAIEAERAAHAALSGSGSGWRECATEGCDHTATVRFERGGVGSEYCHACYMRVQALPAAPQQGSE